MGRKKVNLEKYLEIGTHLTSPRSLEACLRCGVEPVELLPKEKESFIIGKSEVEVDAGEIRYDRFEEQRLHKLKLVRKEYKNVCEEDDMENSVLMLKRQGEEKTSEEDEMQKVKNEAVDSTMVALEERRLERIKLRQEKEIKSMIEMESKMAELQSQNAVREAHEMKRRAEWEAERKKKQAEQVAAKHERELKRKQEEEEEVIRRRQLAKKQAIREQQILAEEKRQEVERQKESRRREAERIVKAEEHRKHTEQLVKAQEDKAMANRMRMMEQERLVQEKMEAANIARQEQALEKRKKAEMRIQSALEQNQSVLRTKKEEFDVKQALAAQRAKEVHMKKLEAIEEQKQAREKEDKLRESRLKQARRLQKERVQHIVQRRQVLDSNLDQVYRVRDHDHTLKIVERNLRLEEKKNNVQRIQKVHEYNRIKVLNKIAQDDAKSKSIKLKKQVLIEARKNFALESQMRKHKIANAVDNMRVSNDWGAMEKLMYVVYRILLSHNIG